MGKKEHKMELNIHSFDTSPMPRHSVSRPHAAARRPDGRLIRQRNDLRGLRYILDFGWLLVEDLGRLMWPNSQDFKRQAYRLVRSWRKRHLVIERLHPEFDQTLLVLSEKGAAFLKKAGIGYAESGSSWGRITNDQWRPGKNWRHDLACTRLSISLSRHGHLITTERQIRAEHADEKPRKWPDLISIKDGETFWIEVESARKSGENLDDLAQAIIDLTFNRTTELLEVDASPVIAYQVDARDTTTGHHIDHLLRVKNAVARLTRTALTLKCFALDNNYFLVKESLVEIEPDSIRNIIRKLDQRGWDAHPSFPENAKCSFNNPKFQGKDGRIIWFGYWPGEHSGINGWHWKIVKEVKSTSAYFSMDRGFEPRTTNMSKHFATMYWSPESDD